MSARILNMEALCSRGNVRGRKAVLEILEAGLQASSAHNEQPWEFIVVTDQGQVKRLAQFKWEHNMQGLIASKVPRLEAETMAGAQRDAFNNTVPIAVIFDRKKRLPLESTWCCITTIWLAACAEGLAASPAFFALQAQGPLKEILGIPETHDIAVILRVGVPEAVPEAKPRKGLSECLSYNRYGEKQ